MPLSVNVTDVQAFLNFLRLKNLSQRTIGEYTWVLQDFLRCTPQELSGLHQITFDHLRDYVASLQARSLAPKTIRDRVIVLKRFFGFLLAEDRMKSDPSQRLPVPKVGKRLPKALSLDETRALLAAIKSDTIVGKRDRLLFELMYSGGLRVNEAVTLRRDDIDFSDGSIRILGKGDKERRIYLKPTVLPLLRENMELTRESEFVFAGRDGKSLSARNVQQRIKLHARNADIKRSVSPHTLRHSIAVHYLQGGAPINFVQGLLGHASLATTGQYLLLTDQMAKDIALRIQTALDKPMVLGERPVGYRLKRIDATWEEYVECVSVWLSDD